MMYEEKVSCHGGYLDLTLKDREDLNRWKNYKRHSGTW